VIRGPIALLLALAACGGREVKLEVAIPGPDSVDAPVAHLGFVALPYNRDSVLALLEAANPRPAGITHALDSLFQTYRGPFMAYASAAYRVQLEQRRLGYLKLRLDSLPRESPAYDSLYRAFGRGNDSLTLLLRRRDEAQRGLAVARNEYMPAIDSLRTLMGRWKDSAYRSYDSLTKSLGTGLGREPWSDSTGADGRATLRLSRGDWWIYARSWDTWDPNSEWYWNLPVTGERLVLDRSNGRRLPRY
jgi:hypothetical protein